MEDALIWSHDAQTWRSSPEDLPDATIGLYEALRADVTPEALRANQTRIGRSLLACAGRSRDEMFPRGGAWPDGLRTVADGLAHIRKIDWFAVRFEVRGASDGRFIARMLRRDRPTLGNPVRLMPVSTDPEDAAYPHKSVRREQL